MKPPGEKWSQGKAGQPGLGLEGHRVRFGAGFAGSCGWDIVVRGEWCCFRFFLSPPKA